MTRVKKWKARKKLLNYATSIDKEDGNHVVNVVYVYILTLPITLVNFKYVGKYLIIWRQNACDFRQHYH